MSKLENNKRKKYESLLNAAYELFTKNNFSQTTISEIAEKAGVAKGTFYLYFKDKFDLRYKLITYKSRQIMQNALDELDKREENNFVERIIFAADNIINQLSNNKPLLEFISKNLVWGIFKNIISSFENKKTNDSINLYERFLEHSPKKLRDPDIMLYMITEMISSTLYSTVILNEPADLETVKPYLYNAIRGIIHDHETE